LDHWLSRSHCVVALLRRNQGCLLRWQRAAPSETHRGGKRALREREDCGSFEYGAGEHGWNSAAKPEHRDSEVARVRSSDGGPVNAPSRPASHFARLVWLQLAPLRIRTRSPWDSRKRSATPAYSIRRKQRCLLRPSRLQIPRASGARTLILPSSTVPKSRGTVFVAQSPEAQQ